MGVLEWVFLVWFSINVVAGTYYASQGGFHYGFGERLFGLAVNLLMLVVMLLSAPLTWVGWTLVVIFAYNVGVNIVRSIRNPEGTRVSATSNVVDVLLSVVLIVLVLTVGVVV